MSNKENIFGPRLQMENKVLSPMFTACSVLKMAIKLLKIWTNATNKSAISTFISSPFLPILVL